MRFARQLSIILCPLLIALTGCARVSDGAAGDQATLTVTADFGADTLAQQRVGAGASVLDTLRGTTDVTTAFGGGFVQAMHGRAAQRSPQRDWFYFVNGLSPNVGAGDATVRSGDRIWWDYRPWGDGPTAPAVVGMWPEPFVNGYPRRPDGVQADPPLDGVLRRAGAPVGPAESAWRVRVGSQADLTRRDAVWRAASADPVRAGLTVRWRGESIERLDGSDDERFVPVPGAAALAAMVLTGESAEQGGALFVVSGVDANAAAAAAATIARTPTVLSARYAVIFDRGGMPIAAPGQAGP